MSTQNMREYRPIYPKASVPSRFPLLNGPYFLITFPSALILCGKSAEKARNLSFKGAKQ